MVHLYLLLFFAASLSLAAVPLVPDDYKVVSVKDFEDIEDNYMNLLKNDQKVVFRIESTKSFLTRRIQKYWDVEDTVHEYQLAQVRSINKMFTKTYRKALFSKNLRDFFKRPPVPYVEFYYSDFSVERSRGLLPISPCHSEILGEGSLIKMQIVLVSRTTPQGTIGVPKALQKFLSSGEAEVEVEYESQAMMNIKCWIPHGQIGQIFLSDTTFLYYTTWYRTVLFDRGKGKLVTNTNFKKRARERTVIKGGLGEWSCATSKLIQLQCFNVVRDITLIDQDLEESPFDQPLLPGMGRNATNRKTKWTNRNSGTTRSGNATIQIVPTRASGTHVARDETKLEEPQFQNMRRYEAWKESKRLGPRIGGTPRKR